MVAENAAVERNSGGSSKASRVPGRSRFWVEVHLFEGGSHVEICDKPIPLTVHSGSGSRPFELRLWRRNVVVGDYVESALYTALANDPSSGLAL